MSSRLIFERGDTVKLYFRAKSPSKRGPNAGYGIRTRELLRDRILSSVMSKLITSPLLILILCARNTSGT